MDLELSVSGPRASEAKLPLWRAKIDVIEVEKPVKSLSVRNLFVNRTPFDFDGKRIVQPGTAVVRGVVDWVRLFPLGGSQADPCGSEAPFRPFDYPSDENPYILKWEGGDFPPYEVLLLVQARPEDWVKRVSSGNNAKQLFFPCCVCLAGEIFLDRLQPVNDSDRKWQRHFPDVKKGARLSVHSSGLCFEGETAMPWEGEAEAVAAPFLAEVPFPSRPGELRLTLDRERMSAEDRWAPTLRRLGEAFRGLADALHPPAEKRPHWSALELVNPEGVPHFHWDVTPARTGEVKTRFRLERGALNLLLSDQQPDRPGVAPRPLLTASPAVTFKSADGFKKEISLSFDEGELSHTFEVGKDTDGNEIEAESPTEASLVAALRGRVLIPRMKNPRRIVWARDPTEPPAGKPGFVLTSAQESALRALGEREEFSPSFRAAVARLLKGLKRTSAFRLTARLEADKWSEEVELANVEAAYDSLSTAILLRRQHALPAPDADESTDEPDILWGFAPLEDGWAQLPFLNLTERHFVDALPAPAPETVTPLLFGAAAFGNDSAEPATLEEFGRRGEQPWGVTLLNGARYAGEWKLERPQASGPWSLRAASVSVLEPELVLNGFLWLGTETPSAADALPSLDDWLASLSMVSLRTPNSSDRFPSPFVLAFEGLTFGKTALPGDAPTDPVVAYPSLRKWSFRYRANEDVVFKRRTLEKPPSEPDHTLFETVLLYGVWRLADLVGVVRGEWPELATKPGLPERLAARREAVWLRLPLVWRRHPTLPAIQTLPLTQNQLPPSHPSPSRQLAPFELTVLAQGDSRMSLPGEWKFGVASDEGAAAWPKLLKDATPARVWRATKQGGQQPESSFLRLALISLPGLVLDPNLAAPVLKQESGFLNAQLLYGLAYTDELNALAQLPKDGERAAEPPPPVVPLTREDYEDYWARLAAKALLARHDADEALEGSPAGSVVRGLVEPFGWGVIATLEDASYPGALRLAEAGGRHLLLETKTALRGLDGSFDEEGGALRLVDPPAAAEFTVVSGSMNAAQEAGGKALRDQRGLSRQATVVVEIKGDALNPVASDPHELYKTPLRFLKVKDKAKAEEFTLYSLQRARVLAAGDDDSRWSLWFRDLPVTGGEFKRSATLSGDRRGVNDPRASTPAFAHLSGYEWRLGDGTTGEDGAPSSHLRLLGFHFFPLTLERVAFGIGDEIGEVEVAGRLQLPAPKSREQSILGNTVRLTFTKVDAGGGQTRLALTKVEAAGPDHDPGEQSPAPEPAGSGDWDLSETDFAPSLRWDKIHLGADRRRLVVEDARLEFFYFDVRWLFPAEAVEFGPDPDAPGQYRAEKTFTSPHGADGPVRVESATLILNLKPARTEATLSARLGFTWGGESDLQLKAAANISLLRPEAPTPGTAPPPDEQKGAVEKVFLMLAGEEHRFEHINASLETGAIQLSFGKLSDASRFFALPGMRLSGDEPVSGFATMAFGVTEVEDALPELGMSSAFCEAIIPCRWGRHLQQPALDASDETQHLLVFGSSAGALYCGYTLSGAAGQNGAEWSSSLLLNGVVEVKNLISWPVPEPVKEGPAGEPIIFPFNKPDANGKPDLSDAAKQILHNVATQLRTNPNLRLRVEGHADGPGAPKDNLKISTRRAEQVKEYLVDKENVPAESITTAAFGAVEPAVPTPGKEPRNRRAEMFILRTAAVTLSAVRPTDENGKPLTKPRLNHIRHTIRVLFNQHAVPREVLGPRSGNLLFDFAPDASAAAGKVWQTVAVVEHQLVDVTMSEADQPPAAAKDPTNDRRWTTVQEVRFAAPAKFHEFLQFLNGPTETSGPASDQKKTAVLRQANVGLNREALLRRLVDDKDASKLKETLLVEASAPHWVSLAQTTAAALTNLQYLPAATQRAILSAPEDFRMRGDGRPSWLLLSLPFLGRLQDLAKDAADAPLGDADSRLQYDPILYLHRRRRDPSAVLSPVALAFASWEDTWFKRVNIAEFDQAYDRQWERLDPATLEESWFRIQHSTPERNGAAPGVKAGAGRPAVLPSVMAALPADSPGR
ncbi:MAG TPA: OmpA family protein, partial [Pyrinomonadaceae bacterium]